MPLATRVNQIYLSHVSGSGVRITRYPTTVGNTGKALTASGNTTGAWKYAAAGANVVEVVAPGTIVVNFKIVGIAVDTPSAASNFVIKVGTGGNGTGAAMGTELFEIQFEFETDAGWYESTMLPSSVQAQITVDGVTDSIDADAASDNALADDTINFHALVATGYGT